MADLFSPAVRSRMMAAVRDKDTKPEMMLRKGLHAKGFRFRLHVKDLPGKPDMVFPRYNAVIFFHGCFWHGHDCHLFSWPKTRQDFWETKINRNRELDILSEAALKNAGWRVGIVWGCALKGRTRVPFDQVIETCGVWLRSDERRLEVRGKDKTMVGEVGLEPTKT